MVHFPLGSDDSSLRRLRPQLAASTALVVYERHAAISPRRGVCQAVEQGEGGDSMLRPAAIARRFSNAVLPWFRPGIFRELSGHDLKSYRPMRWKGEAWPPQTGKSSCSECRAPTLASSSASITIPSYLCVHLIPLVFCVRASFQASWFARGEDKPGDVAMLLMLCTLIFFPCLSFYFSISLFGFGLGSFGLHSQANMNSAHDGKLESWL